MFDTFGTGSNAEILRKCANWTAMAILWYRHNRSHQITAALDYGDSAVLLSVLLGPAHVAFSLLHLPADEVSTVEQVGQHRNAWQLPPAAVSPCLLLHPSAALLPYNARTTGTGASDTGAY